MFRSATTVEEARSNADDRLLHWTARRRFQRLLAEIHFRIRYFLPSPLPWFRPPRTNSAEPSSGASKRLIAASTMPPRSSALGNGGRLTQLHVLRGDGDDGHAAVATFSDKGLITFDQQGQPRVAQLRSVPPGSQSRSADASSIAGSMSWPRASSARAAGADRRPPHHGHRSAALAAGAFPSSRSSSFSRGTASTSPSRRRNSGRFASS